IFRYELPGSVLGVDRESLTVAVKKFEPLYSFSSNDTIFNTSSGYDEVLSLHNLSHINVVQFFGRGSLNGERYMILEYCPRTLSSVFDDYRSRNEHLNSMEYLRWMLEIANGLGFVHKEGHFHGDLKPPNVLISQYGAAKLADFGLCTVPHSKGATLNSSRSTARYMAPEQHSSENLDLIGLQKCDVWSYGLILWEMLTCRQPLPNIPDHQIPLVIGRNNENSRPVLPDSGCESLINLLRR
ncbi:hypothetical protein PMAYCL1PPCAC_19227, partial [Pristionchus mayeri]